MSTHTPGPWEHWSGDIQGIAFRCPDKAGRKIGRQIHVEAGRLCRRARARVWPRPSDRLL